MKSLCGIDCNKFNEDLNFRMGKMSYIRGLNHTNHDHSQSLSYIQW